jgi:hypothetical protein
MKSVTGILVKENGRFVPSSPKDAKKIDMFVNKFQEGDLVEMYMEYMSDDGTLAQLAKVHAMIRQLALHIGENFEDMKLIIKKRAGLCIEKEIEGERFMYCKSLGKCSKQELSLCVEAIKKIGDDIDYPIQ